MQIQGQKRPYEVDETTLTRLVDVSVRARLKGSPAYVTGLVTPFVGPWFAMLDMEENVWKILWRDKTVWIEEDRISPDNLEQALGSTLFSEPRHLGVRFDEGGDYFYWQGMLSGEVLTALAWSQTLSMPYQVVIHPQAAPKSSGTGVVMVRHKQLSRAFDGANAIATCDDTSDTSVAVLSEPFTIPATEAAQKKEGIVVVDDYPILTIASDGFGLLSITVIVTEATEPYSFFAEEVPLDVLLEALTTQ